MIEVTILIPMADYNNVAFTPAHHAAFEADLLSHFGGFQLAVGNVTGQWKDAGTIYADELREYKVAVKGMIEAGGELAATVAFAKGHYSQLAVYVRYLGNCEIL